MDMAFRVGPDNWVRVKMIEHHEGSKYTVAFTSNSTPFLADRDQLGIITPPPIGANDYAARGPKREPFLRIRPGSVIVSGDVVVGLVGHRRLPRPFTVARSSVTAGDQIRLESSDMATPDMYVSPRVRVVVESDH